MCSWGTNDARISMCVVPDLFLAFSNNLRLRVRGVGLVVTQGKVGWFFISFYLVEANTVVLAKLTEIQPREPWYLWREMLIQWDSLYSL